MPYRAPVADFRFLLGAPERSQGLTGVVFLVSSVLITVPSGFSVTVFSFDLTVPSLLTLVLSVLEIVRSQPTMRNDNAKADVVDKTAILFFMSGRLSAAPAAGYGV